MRKRLSGSKKKVILSLVAVVLVVVFVIFVRPMLLAREIGGIVGSGDLKIEKCSIKCGVAHNGESITSENMGTIEAWVIKEKSLSGNEANDVARVFLSKLREYCTNVRPNRLLEFALFHQIDFTSPEYDGTFWFGHVPDDETLVQYSVRSGEGRWSDEPQSGMMILRGEAGPELERLIASKFDD